MSYARDREDFIYKAAKLGIEGASIRRLLRYASTLQRLAEASCNGDWPADNGERKVKPCVRCGGCWVPSVLKLGGCCPDCRTEDLIKAVPMPAGLRVETSGDPRGYVSRILSGSGDRPFQLGIPSRY